MHPLEQKFTCEGVDVWMIHIGGYPGRYPAELKRRMAASPPGLFICGHSHVLKVMRDASLANMLHINPGAAGKHGFHKERTMVTFKIDDKRILDLEVVVLGKK
jgi:predicted phosphodiesterase